MASLYKYVHPERLDVLRNSKIRFSQAAALNDPFELRPSLADVLSKIDWERALELNENLLRASLGEAYDKLEPHRRPALQRETWISLRVGEIERNPAIRDEVVAGIRANLDLARPRFTETANEMMAKEMTRRFGVLSVSEVPDSGLMWAHYAAEGTGFVIEFDAANPFFDQRRNSVDDFYHMRRVVYSENRGHVTSIDALTAETMFLEKQSQWAYEREWRMIVPLDSHQPIDSSVVVPVHLLDFPPAAVRSVVVGYRSSDQFAAEVESIVSQLPYSGVHIKRSVLDYRKRTITIV
jgi:Protein of unknown function (DUF2971)